MNITIRRYHQHSEAIDGEVLVDSLPFCECAENATTALPAGTYPIVIMRCHQYARKQPCVVIQNPPSCEQCPRLSLVGINTNKPLFCPQICPGNGVYNRTDGAIIVGQKLTSGSLIHPKRAFYRLYNRMYKAHQRGQRLQITIEEHYDKPLPVPTN